MNVSTWNSWSPDETHQVVFFPTVELLVVPSWCPRPTSHAPRRSRLPLDDRCGSAMRAGKHSRAWALIVIRPSLESAGALAATSALGFTVRKSRFHQQAGISILHISIIHDSNLIVLGVYHSNQCFPIPHKYRFVTLFLFLYFFFVFSLFLFFILT